MAGTAGRHRLKAGKLARPRSPERSFQLKTWRAWRSSSLIASRPMTTATSSTPERTCRKPKSKRVIWPIGSSPTMPMAIPNVADMRPLTTLSPVRLISATMPRQ
jgi:hypothetical protein